MKMLSRQAFAAACAFVTTQGRPLDQARIQFHFAAGSAAAVLAELAQFQNADGGFGCALEPDLRTSASSAIATATALAILREIAAPATTPLIRRAVDYLLLTFDQTKQVWPIVPPAVEDAPHAPWWAYAQSEEGFGGFIVNPRVVLLAHLYDYPELVPERLLAQLTTAALAHLATVNKLDMFEIHCYTALAEAKHLPSAQRAQVEAKLRSLVPAAVEYDQQQWTEYCLLPLDVVPTPTSFLADVIEPTAVQANLDFLIDRQLPDGSWPIPWSWAFVDEQAWAQAKQEWQGFTTVNHLRTLRAYQRIFDRA